MQQRLVMNSAFQLHVYKQRTYKRGGALLTSALFTLATRDEESVTSTGVARPGRTRREQRMPKVEKRMVIWNSGN